MKNYLLITISIVLSLSIFSCMSEVESDLTVPELLVFQLGNESDVVAAGDTLAIQMSASDDKGLFNFYMVLFSYHNDTFDLASATNARIDTVYPKNIRAIASISGNSVSNTFKIPLEENTAAGYYLANGWVTDLSGNVSLVKNVPITVTNAQSPTLGLLFPDVAEQLTVKAGDSILLKGEAMDNEGLFLLEADLYTELFQLVQRVSLADSVKGMTSATFEKQFVVDNSLSKGVYTLHVKAWDNDGGLKVPYFRLNANTSSKVIKVEIK